MKHKVTELDMDYIGGERPLTKEDEKAFSEYLKKEKLLRVKKISGVSMSNIHLKSYKSDKFKHLYSLLANG